MTFIESGTSVMVAYGVYGSSQVVSFGVTDSNPLSVLVSLTFTSSALTVMSDGKEVIQRQAIPSSYTRRMSEKGWAKSIRSWRYSSVKRANLPYKGVMTDRELSL